MRAIGRSYKDFRRRTGLTRLQMPVSMMVTAHVLTMRALRRKAIAGEVVYSCHVTLGLSIKTCPAGNNGRAPSSAPGPEHSSVAAAPLLPSCDQSPSGLAPIVVNQTQGFSQACSRISERSANFGSVLLRQSVSRRTPLSTALVPLTLIYQAGQGVPCST